MSEKKKKKAKKPSTFEQDTRARQGILVMIILLMCCMIAVTIFFETKNTSEQRVINRNLKDNLSKERAQRKLLEQKLQLLKPRP